MASTIITNQNVATRAVAVLHDKLLMPAWINRQYSNEYAKRGAKTGDTVKVRVPTRLTTSLQNGVNAMTFQGIGEKYVDLVLTAQRAVPLAFSQQELTLEMEDFSKQVIEPAAAQLSSDIESDLIAAVSPYIANAVVGTGTNAPKWVDILKAGAKMTQFTAPTADRYIMIDPVDEVAIIDELKGLFQDASMVAQQNLEGFVGRTGGFLWGRSNRLPTIVIGSDVAGALTADAVEGSNEIVVGSFAANQVIAAGTVVSITARNAVGPETRTSLGYAKQFSVIEEVTLSGAGAGTLKLNEKIYFGATADKNISSKPVNTDVVTILGTANKTYRQVLCFQRDAFTMATVDLIPDADGVKVGRDQMDGISMTYVSQFDAATYQSFKRLDVLYGMAALRPEYAAKVLVEVA
jgi:hypothetical protein